MFLQMSYVLKPIIVKISASGRHGINFSGCVPTPFK